MFDFEATLHFRHFSGNYSALLQARAASSARKTQRLPIELDTNVSVDSRGPCPIRGCSRRQDRSTCSEGVVHGVQKHTRESTWSPSSALTGTTRRRKRPRQLSPCLGCARTQLSHGKGSQTRADTQPQKHLPPHTHSHIHASSFKLEQVSQPLDTSV